MTGVLLGEVVATAGLIGLIFALSRVRPRAAVGRRPLEDPADQGIDAVRPIRDAIRTNVEQLLGELLPDREPA